MTQSFVHLVLSDRRPVPLSRVHEWADALEFEEEAKEAFIQDVFLAATPEAIVAKLTRLENEVTQLRCDLAKRQTSSMS